MEKMLLVGNDSPLLLSRAAVLTSTRAAVVACNPAEIAGRLGHDKFDLIILCHSLEDDIRKSVCADVERRWPQARILEVLADHDQRSSVDCHVDASTVAGEPCKLIELAMELLGKRHERLRECPEGLRVAFLPATVSS